MSNSLTLQIPSFSSHLATSLEACLEASWSCARSWGVLFASASVTFLCPWVWHRRYLIVSAEKFTWVGNKGVQNVLELNVRSMQILPLFLSLSLSLSQKIIFFYLADKILYWPLLRLRRAFRRHLCLPPHCLWFCPHQAPRGENVTLPCPCTGLRVLQLPRPTDPTRKQVLPLATPIPNSIFSIPRVPLTSLSSSPSPIKALGSSFMKCGLKIIFGKLTTLCLPFPPTSEKKEHPEALVATS